MSIIKKKFPVPQIQVELKQSENFSNSFIEINDGLYCKLKIKAYKFIILSIDYERIYNLLRLSKKFVHRNLSLFYGIKLDNFKNSKEFSLLLVFENLESNPNNGGLTRENLTEILLQITDLFIFFNSLSIDVVLFPQDVVILKNSEIRFNNLYLNYFIKEFLGFEKLLSFKNTINYGKEMNNNDYYINIISSLISNIDYKDNQNLGEIMNILEENSIELLLRVSNYLKSLDKYLLYKIRPTKSPMNNKSSELYSQLLIYKESNSI